MKEENIPKVVREELVDLGVAKLTCYHLDNGQRVYEALEFAKALGFETIEEFQKTTSEVFSRLSPERQLEILGSLSRD